MYKKCNDLVVKIFRNDKEAKNYIQKSRELSYESEINKINIEDEPNDIFLTK